MAEPPFKPTRKLKLVGHLVGVPISDGSTRVCAVLWESRYYKSVITLGITDLEVVDGQYPDNIDSLISLIDTSATVIRSGFWHLGPKIDVSIPSGFSTRRVAGTIWCDDKEVGDATREDRHVVPELGCAGMGMVEQYITFLDEGDANAKLFIRNRKLMESHLQRYPIRFK